MLKISSRQQKIINIFLKKGEAGSGDLHQELIKLEEIVSLVTVKRALSEMSKSGLLRLSGSGRSTVYSLSALGRLFAAVDASQYCAIEPDSRCGQNKYNFNLLAELPKDIFTDQELEALNKATRFYQSRVKNLPVAIQKKELERLIIELSWKSSKIEGNTYTLLDTERLILENKAATGKTKQETRMILNHKDAFQFIHEHKNQFKELNRKNLEQLHIILVKDLKVGLGLRHKPVGVIGSIYKPLDNIHQITEAVEILAKTVFKIPTAYGKALVALLGISYIQPFEDGNKRTGRLIANALLLAHGCAPLSYRSVKENEYREANLVFYELNSLVPFKKIFIEQYDFSAKNYLAK